MVERHQTCQGTPIVSRDTQWVKGHQTCQGTPKGKIFTKDTDRMDQGYQSVSNASSVEQDEQFKRLLQLCFKWLNLGRVEAKKEPNYLLFCSSFVFILGRTRRLGWKNSFSSSVVPGDGDEKKAASKKGEVGLRLCEALLDPNRTLDLFSFP